MSPPSENFHSPEPRGNVFYCPQFEETEARDGDADLAMSWFHLEKGYFLLPSSWYSAVFWI